MTNLSPKEYAKELLDKCTHNWELIFPGNPNLKKFILETAHNDISELDMRRQEIFKPDQPEHQSEYWQHVKSEIELL